MKGSFWQLYTACIQYNNNRNFHIYIIVQHIARKTALHNALQFPMIYDSINCSSQLSIRHKIFRLFTNQVSLVHIGKRWVGTLINIQNAVDDSPVNDFRYLGSIQSSSGRCYPDIHRRIGVASSCHACHAALLATTEIEFGHQTATLPNLSLIHIWRCRRRG